MVSFDISRSQWPAKFPFAVAIFTSAFLVFQVQPVVARYILPWFGGTANVWTVCMLFFQIGLLAGYVYAHLLVNYLGSLSQIFVHGSLLLLSLFVLPITPSFVEMGEGTYESIQILYILTQSVGIPFVLLSASAPLLQHWFANVNPGSSPFRLYALSNVGSLLALLSYPFFIERILSLSSQTVVWSVLFAMYVVLVGWCAVWVRKRNRESGPKSSTTQDVSSGSTALRTSSVFDRLVWVLFAALGSVSLLAITNQMSLDISVVPFLWILPLSLYLVTFIISFERDAWYLRGVWYPFFVLSIAALVILLRRDFPGGEPPVMYQIGIYCSALFACCMICHGELARAKASVSELTSFYVYVALGGAIGGLLVNVVSPLVFDGYWELHTVLVVIALCMGIVLRASLKGRSFAQRGTATLAMSTVLLVLVMGLGTQMRDSLDESIYDSRTFYGILHVYEENRGSEDHILKLRHGRIGHGKQLVQTHRNRIPTSYYGESTAAGITLTEFPVAHRADSTLHVGGIGMGIGTILTYGKEGDKYSFYEISSEVQRIAQDYFYYIEQSLAEVDIRIGDGRRVLQKELDEGSVQNFDVLVLDAFSGDAIPIHLLSVEASNLYWGHLKEDGVLVVHISNRHIDLSDVVRQMASYAGKQAYFMEDYGETADYLSGSSWVIVTDNEAFLANPIVQENISDWERDAKPILWTDDFSNLYDVIEWE